MDSVSLDSLCENFPETNKVGHTYIKDVTLSKEWEAFTREIYSSEYRDAIENITGLDLSGYEVGIGIRRHSKISHGAPHSDVPRKKVTHLMYFNDEWPHDTGRIKVLGSENLSDVHDSVTPVKGAGLMFIVANNSFHGFEPYEGVRQAMQINFEKTGLFSKMFERYK